MLKHCLSSNQFDGAQKRIFDISKSLSKKNKVDFVCLGENVLEKKPNLNFLNKLIIYKTGFFSKIYNVIIAILKFQPMQNGYFFSKDICNFISENKQDSQFPYSTHTLEGNLKNNETDRTLY